MAETSEIADLVRRARKLRLSVLRQVRTHLAGSYASAFRGPGIEFQSVRPYQPGDDVRRIDWRVTARRPTAYVRRYQQERELRLLLALDASDSMCAGPRPARPAQRALLATAALGLAAAQNGDRVGALLFGEDVVAAIPARSGERHVLSILRRALEAPGGGSSTDLRPVLSQLRNCRGHVVAVLLSDFLTDPPPWAPDVRRILAAVARKHRLLAVHLPALARLPAGVILDGVDPESGRAVRVDASAGLKAPAADALRLHRGRTRDTLLQCGVPCVEIAGGTDPIPPLHRLLAQRRGARRA